MIRPIYITLFAVLGAIIFINALFFIPTINREIIQPAKFSVSVVCDVPDLEVESGIIAGLTKDYGNGTTSIQFFDNPNTDEREDLSPNTKVIKHELCHLHQTQRRLAFSKSCEDRTQKFLTEVECYIAEELNDRTFEFLYGGLSSFR